MKKILLLASMALALAAFAAPAAQAHPEWFLNEETLEEPVNFTIAGSLSSVVSFTTGPCNVEFEGVAFNENTMADGEVTDGTIQAHCPVALPVPGCTVTPTLEGLDNGGTWPITGITVTEGLEAFEIQDAAIENHYSASCVAAGVPPTVTAEGDATALVEQSGTRPHECITFEGHKDHLKVTFPAIGEPSTDIEGTACIESPEGLTLTPHHE